MRPVITIGSARPSPEGLSLTQKRNDTHVVANARSVAASTPSGLLVTGFTRPADGPLDAGGADAATGQP